MSVNEEASDKCMRELMGGDELYTKSCNISEHCATTMSYPGLIGYGITHQILWIMLAEKVLNMPDQMFSGVILIC